MQRCTDTFFPSHCILWIRVVQLYRETWTDPEQRNRFRDRSVSRESMN